MAQLELNMLAWSANACWFSSKKKALSHIRKWVEKHGYEEKKGVTRHELAHEIEKLPGTLGWLVHKAGGVNTVFEHCDTNKDDRLEFDEARHNKHCLETCWKQTAVTTL